jgi:hypothetical protein
LLQPRTLRRYRRFRRHRVWYCRAQARSPRSWRRTRLIVSSLNKSAGTTITTGTIATGIIGIITTGTTAIGITGITTTGTTGIIATTGITTTSNLILVLPRTQIIFVRLSLCRSEPDGLG